MKICAYVQEQYTKTAYSNESMDARQFVGLKVIVDSLMQAGYAVEYAGIATVHLYDIVLVSLTSDCDWWSFIAERTRWQNGSYNVIIGGAGLMHIAPFLPFGDYFSFGRGEQTLVELVRALDGKGDCTSDSICDARTFSPDKVYHIQQAQAPYPHPIRIDDKSEWNEGMIGCNHKCLFCGYTWHRKCNYNQAFMWDSGKTNMSDKECAMLDWESGKYKVNWSRLRTTAIDGFSERLRYMVNKRISRRSVEMFLRDMILSDAKPHQIKLFNVCGLPTETEADWWELIDVFKSTDAYMSPHGKQWSIVLHSTPFRPMPATPLACAPMSYRNYRGEIGRILGKGLKGNIIYQGRALWAVESMGTESLPTVILSAICHRGSADDTENIIRIARSKKFWSAPVLVRQATLEKYFDVGRLFGAFTAQTLPSRYLRTYAHVERMWPRESDGQERGISEGD